VNHLDQTTATANRGALRGEGPYIITLRVDRREYDDDERSRFGGRGDSRCCQERLGDLKTNGRTSTRGGRVATDGRSRRGRAKSGRRNDVCVDDGRTGEVAEWKWGSGVYKGSDAGIESDIEMERAGRT
jgi:hypothetical protein